MLARCTALTLWVVDRWAPFDPLASLTQSVSNVANLDPLQSFAKGASGLWGFSGGAKKP